jgi:flagellar motility protein MotE (MotC chaperone)
VVQAYEQVARILAGMKPDEAGQILAHLSDAQVEGLVRQMSPRQAAKLLSLIPPERGGLLSRRLLERPGLPRP